MDIDVTQLTWVTPLALGEGEEVVPQLPDIRGENRRTEEGRDKPTTTDGGGVEARGWGEPTTDARGGRHKPMEEHAFAGKRTAEQCETH